MTTSDKHIRLIWISALLIIGIILGFFIIKPFLSEIFLAIVLAIVAYPIHSHIKKRIPTAGLASFMTSIFVLLVVVVPLSLVGTLVVKELVSFATSFGTEGQSLVDAISRLDTALANRISLYDAGTLSVETTEAYVGDIMRWLADNLQNIFTNILDWFISIAILLLALYYLLKDGDKVYKGILYTSPLEDSLDETIGKEIVSIIRAVISGRLVVGLVQGFATYLGFIFFGIENALLLATLAALLAILPLLGPILVIIPVSLYQFALGDTFPGVGLMLWGLIVVEFIDNVLGPILIHSRTNLHPFVVLISILGGFHVFGPVGFVAGPVVVGIVYALFRTMPMIYRESKQT